MPTFKDPSGAYHWTSMSAAPSGAPPGAAEGSTWTLTTGVKYRYNQAESLWVLVDTQPAHTFVVLGASTADIADLTSPGATLDGLTLANEDGAYFLLKDQSTGAENGVYKYTHSSTTLSRAEFMDNDQELVGGVEVRVNEGTANADTTWRCTTNDAITVGTTATTWVEEGGNVSGPASSTDNAVARWDGTGGRTLQDSAVLIDDSDNITGVGTLATSGDITVGTTTTVRAETAGVTGAVSLAELTGNGTNTTTVKAADSITANNEITLPVNGGAAFFLYAISKQVTTTELTDAATSQSIDFDDTIPAGSIVVGADLNIATLFSGGSVSDLDIDIGISGGDLNRYIEDAPAFTGDPTGRVLGTAGVAFASDDSNLGKAYEAAQVTPAVTVKSVTDNVVNLTAGDATATIWYLAP